MKKIIFMSRLDKDCSHAAYLLCSIADRLVQKYPDIQIIIIGGGAEYRSIFKKAEEINQKYYRKVIFATGKLIEPLSYFDTNALFIGVSRSALEAMSYGMPIILLGNEGYLGLLDEHNLKLAIETNLTCRCSPRLPNQVELLTEIISFFELSDDEKARLKALSKRIIKEEFSARKMADKTLSFYNKISTEYKKSISKLPQKNTRRKKICICGYYGRGNLGDDEILREIIRKIKSSRLKSSEISIIKDKNPIKILSSLYNADLFIFGGGSLLQNSTSNASLFFYLLIIFLANIFCNDKIMLSNGIGPIKKDKVIGTTIEKATKHAINTFDIITVRDLDSQKYLQNILPNRKIQTINDPAIIPLCEHTGNLDKKLTESYRSNTGELVFIPNAQALVNSNITFKDVSDSIGKACKHLNALPKIIVLNKEDHTLSKKIAESIPQSTLSVPYSSKELILSLKNAKICISQRYHGAIYSVACKIPTVAISSDPKLNALCKELKLQRAQPISVLKSESKVKSLCDKAELQGLSDESISVLRQYAKRSESAISRILEYF